MRSDWNVRFAEAIFRSVVKTAKHFKCRKYVLSKRLTFIFDTMLRHVLFITIKHDKNYHILGEF